MKKLVLAGLCLMALSGCDANPVKVIYDCSGVSLEDKAALKEMYSRCDIRKSLVTECKNDAIEAVCKPTPYLVPEEYFGNNIKPALKASEGKSENDAASLSQALEAIQDKAKQE